MRRIIKWLPLLALLALLCPSPSHAYAYVQHCVGDVNVTGSPANCTLTLGANHLVVWALFTCGPGPTAGSTYDTLTLAYQAGPAAFGWPGGGGCNFRNRSMTILSACTGAGGADTISLTTSPVTIVATFFFIEYSGITGCNSKDGTGAITSGTLGGAGTISSGNAVTTSASDMLFGFGQSIDILSVGTGYTLRACYLIANDGGGTPLTMCFEDKSSGAPGNYDADWNAQAGYQLVNTGVVQNATSGAAITIDNTFGMAGARTIIVSLGCSSVPGTACGTVTGITTTGGSCSPGAFAQKASQTFAGGYTSAIWGATDCVNSITKFTPSWSVGGTMSVRWWTIWRLSTTTDGTGVSSGALDSFPTPNGASVTTALTGDFIVSNYDPQNNVTNCAASPSWTEAGDGAKVGHCYLTSHAAAPGTYNAKFTTSSAGTWTSTAVAFVPFSPGPGGIWVSAVQPFGSSVALPTKIKTKIIRYPMNRRRNRHVQTIGE